MDTALRDLRQRQVALPSLFVVAVVALGIGLALGWSAWILGLAFLIPTALASYRRPQRGVLIFSAILPFDGMIKALGPASADSWKQVFIVGLLVLTFICPEDARSPGHRELPGWVPAFIGLLALGLITAAFVDRTTAMTGLRI